jgi:dTDP-4-amino-4,6-dideoxygalactose transaminase
MPTLDDLGIFSGRPAFAEPLHVGRPNIGNRATLMRRINDLLDRRWLTNDGPFVREFEQNIAASVGVRHCVCMCNATVALEIAIRALGLRGEVIVPSFTFIATAHALQWQEITPVFCDIEPRTHTIDPARAAALITPRTTGIIGVHLWGRACAVGDLADLARRRGLKLLFDAAHAFGCSLDGKRIGGFGHAEVFSFHATKFINTFEGGAVVTNDDELAAKMRLMRNFGFAGYDNVVYLGTNGKMPEVAAAMGLSSLEEMGAILEANRTNHLRYREGLAGLPGVTVLTSDDRETSNYQYVVLEIEARPGSVDRDALLRVLQAENVMARRYFFPGCHRMEPYRSLEPGAGQRLPVTEGVAGRVLVLPTGTTVDGSAIDTIVRVIRMAVKNGPELRERLRRLA